ncbi:hypothetical protein [Tritonibacter mobilis]|uniref:hypothetical protein n=1 Tax=Tritonibacter mobilis TaxID=379347 RepID=UPI000806A6B4|nr:hypothetical protein [Tritonibacter mobilis]
MVQLHAALVREQNVTFAVAIMKDHVLNNPSTADQQIQAVAAALGCSLVVLMGERNRKLRGNRKDVVDFVARIDPSRLPWRKYTV